MRFGCTWPFYLGFSEKDGAEISEDDSKTEQSPIGNQGDQQSTYNMHNILRQYMPFNDIYSRAFGDFIPSLDVLSNARLMHQIINPVTLGRYHRTISYD